MGKQGQTALLTPGVRHDDATQADYYESNGTSPIEMQKKSDDAAWQKTQAANRPWQYNDFGSSMWSQSPDGSWTQKSSLNGPLGEANQNLQKQWADTLSKPMDDGTGARNQAIGASYGQAASRLDPQWDKRQSAMQTQLLNQGLDPSSEAYKSASQDFGQQRNDAYTSAMNMAIGQGTAAGDSAFKNNLAARNSPLQLMEGMKDLTKQAPTPQVSGAPTMQWLNSIIANNNTAIGKATQQNQNTADTVQGGAEAAAAIGTLAAMFA